MDQHEYSVSIIIPTYDRAAFLRHVSLPSVVRQTVPALECIVVDDGSTDDTAAVVRRFIEENPGTDIKYVHQGNAGVAAARNAGIARAKGEWVLALDSDDALLDDALETLIAAARNGADIVRGRTWRVDFQTGRIRGIGGSTPSSVLLRKSIFSKYGPYDEDRDIIEDIDHMFRLLPFIEEGTLVMPYLDHATTVYFSHGGQVTNLATASRLVVKERAMIGKWGSRLPDTPRGKGNIAHLWRNKGVYEILSGDTKEGRRSLAASLRIRWSWGTLFLYGCAYGGTRVMRSFVVPMRRASETLGFRLGLIRFALKHHAEFRRGRSEARRIARSAQGRETEHMR